MPALRYLSVCSGIEAASVAWRPLGWQAAAFAEIDAFSSAVLAHHYPDVPNLIDMCSINGADFLGKIDVLVGGTPCQSFSIAGLRRGLQDKRGNLTLQFVRIANESAPAFIVWENVPGILSDRRNAFGYFLGALAGEEAPLEPPGGRWQDAGYVLGPARSICWRILDAQYFVLAQRRRRVFLVACPRDGADPRQVLFEFEGLHRHTAPRRQARQEVAGSLASSFGRRGGAGSIVGNPGTDVDTIETLQVVGTLGNGSGKRGWRISAEEAASGHIIAQAMSCKWAKGTSGPAGDEHHNLVVTPPLTGNQYGDHESREGLLVPVDAPAVSAVRRITPLECERLMGFPDNYTLIPYRGKLTADGPRYKALGNSFAVPVIKWIGRRIQVVMQGIEAHHEA